MVIEGPHEVDIGHDVVVAPYRVPASGLHGYGPPGIGPRLRSDVRDWLDENATGVWYCSWVTGFYFDVYEDAVQFALRWL